MSSTAARSEKPSTDRLLGIELLRFASAMAVLVFHFQHFAYVGSVQPGFSPDQQPGYSLLKLLYKYGFYGVEVFWCISGFIFFWKYGQPIARKLVSGREFFVLRLSRLYPLHLATLLLVALGQYLYRREAGGDFVYAHNDPYHFLLQLFMASNWGLQVGDSFNGPIWSISIEVLVYALFYLALRLLGSSYVTLVGLLLAAVAVLGSRLSQHQFFYCVVFFFTGCLVATIHAKARESFFWKRGATIAALLLLATGIAALAADRISPLAFVWLGSPALVFLCVNFLKPQGNLAGLLAAGGNITYASYLLHVPVQLVVCWLFLRTGVDVPWRSAWFLGTYLIAMLVLSHLCFIVFEMPAQTWMRRRLLARRSRAVGS